VMWPTVGDDAARRDNGRLYHDARRHLAGAEHTGPPDGLMRSPPVRPPEPAALCAVLIAPRGCPGHRLPLVALMAQWWRQDYATKRPPPSAVICVAGQKPPLALQKPPLALQKRLGDFRLPPPNSGRTGVADANSLVVTARGWYLDARSRRLP
jgi:hypothetical protein